MSENIRIAVLSDTHGLLRPEVLEIVDTCSIVLHGGDIDRPGILETLSRKHFIYAVRGNNDGEWASGLRLKLSFEIGQVRFLMVHDRRDAGTDIQGADVVVFGHSHKYEEKQEGPRLWLNPGSCGPRRFSQPVTMAVMTVGEGKWQVERIEIPCGPKGK